MSDVTYVLVRLPLTDEQERAIVVAQTGTPPSVKTDTEAAIRAIGTPVEASGLETVAFANPEEVNEPIGDEAAFFEVADKRYGHLREPLVRQSDAAAQIALRDAQIAELTAQLDTIAQETREAIAAWIEPQRPNIGATGAEFAAAIRSAGEKA